MRVWLGACGFGVCATLLLAACSSLPDVQFDGADGGTDSGLALADADARGDSEAGAKLDAGGDAPDANEGGSMCKPPSGGICCGAYGCIGCQESNCGDCMQKACSGGSICCAAGSNNVACKNPQDC